MTIASWRFWRRQKFNRRHHRVNIVILGKESLLPISASQNTKDLNGARAMALASQRNYYTFAKWNEILMGREKKSCCIRRNMISSLIYDCSALSIIAASCPSQVHKRATSSPLENFRRQNCSTNRWLKPGLYIWNLDLNVEWKDKKELATGRVQQSRQQDMSCDLMPKQKAISEDNASLGEQKESECWSSLRNLSTMTHQQYLTPLKVWKPAVKQRSPSAFLCYL